MTTWKDVIETGDVNVVKDYIASGADVNTTDKVNGLTALMRAAGAGHFDVVELLIEEGADISAMNNYLDIAKENGHTDIVTLLEKAMK